MLGKCRRPSLRDPADPRGTDITSCASEQMASIERQGTGVSTAHESETWWRSLAPIRAHVALSLLEGFRLFSG
jgi:hypothetical protein